MQQVATGDIFRERRRKFLPIFIAVPILYFLVLAPVYVFMVHDRVLSVVHIFGLVTSLALAVYYWLSGDDKRVVFAFCGLAVITVVTDIYTGGLKGSGLFTAFPYIPFIAFLQPRRRALPWLLFMLIAILMLVVFVHIGLATFPDTEVVYLLYAFNFLIDIALVAAYVREKENSDKLVDDKTLEISKINGELNEQLQKKEVLTKQMLAQAKVLELNRAKLMRASHKIEAIIDNIGEPLTVSDTKGRIIRANHAFVQLFGYTEEEILNKDATKIIRAWTLDNQEIKREERALHKALHEKAPKHIRYIVARKDGSKFIADGFVTPYYYGKKLLGTINIVRDISEEHAVDRAKSEFVSLASHQLRSPLTGIKWNIELLNESLAKSSMPDQKELVQEMAKGVEGMIDMVNSLLNTAYIELNQPKIEPEKLDITKLFEETLVEQKNVLQLNQIKVEMTGTKDLNPVVTDGKMLRIVIENLVSNAIKYSNRAETVIIVFRNRKDAIEFDITNFGILIPRQNQMFKKFFRSDEAILAGIDGTGLGLYNVREILRQLGGSVSFTSSRKSGTTFTVTLPNAKTGLHTRVKHKGVE